MDARYLKYEVASGLVLNAEVWSAEPEASDGLAYVASDEGGPGWRYEGGVLSPPVVSIEALAAEKYAAAEAAFQEHRQSPMSWDFGSIVALDDNEVDQGAAGVQTLQMRDDGVSDDQKNWIAAGLGAVLAVAGGGGALVQPIKVTANVWVQTTAADAVKVLVSGDGPTKPSALQRGRAMIARNGVIKAAIKAALEANDPAALLALDVNAGWPD